MKRVVRRFGAAAFAALVGLVAAGHVGSPNVFFAGRAGPYDVTVVVRPPQVVPGLAEITVRIPADEGSDVRRVLVRPVFWATGTRGSPAPDEATRLEAPEPTFAGRLWLMSGGSYSVHVTVEGARGSGTAIVPVAAVATARLALGRGLTILLAVLGTVLFVGLVSIVRAAASDTLLAPGESAGARMRRRRTIVTAVTVPLLAMVCLGGWRWWNAEARAYERSLYRPLAVITTASADGGGRRLTMEVTDSVWRAGRRSRLIPDHGKFMHMFLIRDPDLGAFAHVHPTMRDDNTFEVALPPIPAGRYRVYGDVVHESGLERTLVDTVDVPPLPAGDATASALGSSGDDAWSVRGDVGAYEPAGTGSLLGDGSVLVWRGFAAPIVAGREVRLRFLATDSLSRPLALEPYMGMTAHAVVTRREGDVFIHLHPMGTVTMASQQAFALRDRGDTVPGGRLRLDDSASIAGLSAMAGMAPMGAGSEISFPYEFPRAGSYRIWVQVKHAGRVLTGTFDIEVAPGPSSGD